jgi:hypothetical protein
MELKESHDVRIDVANGGISLGNSVWRDGR